MRFSSLTIIVSPSLLIIISCFINNVPVSARQIKSPNAVRG
nr:MAG TPA: hypothetical protein [Caudoviricetes sp.]